MLPPSGFTYGGLHSRYQKRKRRLVRMIDPITALPVEFSTPLRSDNWLLRNFCPGSWECVVEPASLRIFRMGAEVAPYCDLLTTFLDRVRIADLVVDVMTPQLAQTWEQLQSTCQFYGITPHLRLRTLVRENLTLLANLDRMRQHLILHTTDAREEHSVRNQMAKKAASTPEQLYAVLAASVLPAKVDAALFTYYRAGTIFINLAEVPYGPHSQIRAI